MSNEQFAALFLVLTAIGIGVIGHPTVGCLFGALSAFCAFYAIKEDPK